jgi:hypothetical protein
VYGKVWRMQKTKLILNQYYLFASLAKKANINTIATTTPTNVNRPCHPKNIIYPPFKNKQLTHIIERSYLKVWLKLIF